jgi:endonuclease/exonuclease/phosphatase family metal-dependent hydrolase
MDIGIAESPYIHNAASSKCSRRNLLQVLTGDLNAEPHESAITLLKHGRQPVGGEPTLTESISLDVAASSTTSVEADEGVSPGLSMPGFKLVDAWHTFNDHENEDATGFTFPACAPVKRIDFIFMAQDEGNDDALDSKSNQQKTQECYESASATRRRIDNVAIPRVEILGKLPSPESGMFG